MYEVPSLICFIYLCHVLYIYAMFHLFMPFFIYIYAMFYIYLCHVLYICAMFYIYAMFFILMSISIYVHYYAPRFGFLLYCLLSFMLYQHIFTFHQRNKL